MTAFAAAGSKLYIGQPVPAEPDFDRQDWTEVSRVVRIRFVAGAADASMQEAILQLAAWWFENREAATIGDAAKAVPFGVAEIVQEHRGWTF